MSSKIREGKKLRCRRCGDLVATIAKDIVPGTLLTEDLFHWENQTFADGKTFNCQECGDNLKKTLDEMLEEVTAMWGEGQIWITI